jgi:hypothetical protein
MALTETQAKTKWCPQAMVSTGEGSCNRFPGSSSDIPSGTRCMGSSCALWEWNFIDPLEKVENTGYCGLRGTAP